MTNSRFLIAVFAYIVPTFIAGVVWHLFAFAHVYEALQIYRPNLLFPLGIGSMVIQGCFLAWLFPRIAGSGAWVQEGLRFGAITGLAFWLALVLPVAAKNVMTSVSTFVLVETGFTALQFFVAGLAIAFVYRTRAVDQAVTT